jgi:hypothetical protein
MSLRSRITRLEKKLERYKPLPVIMFVSPFLGETLETKYQKYLDEGGDPKAEILWFIYQDPPKEKITNPSYVPR